MSQQAAFLDFQTFLGLEMKRARVFQLLIVLCSPLLPDSGHSLPYHLSQNQVIEQGVAPISLSLLSMTSWVGTSWCRLLLT